MEEFVTLTYNGQEIKLPVVIGTEGEKAIDISTLRQDTGFITLDPGYANTGSCLSAITYMDGEKGILRYRGIPVEQLAAHATFKETAYLLINGKLPNREQLTHFSVMLNDNSLVHEDLRTFFQSFPRASHPMGILSAMVNALRSFYPELGSTEEEINITMTRLLAKVRTMAAMSYKISRGHKVIYPRPDMTYCENFLNMMFDTPVKPYEINRAAVNALRVFWILHADHEQNCSTSPSASWAVRGSTSTPPSHRVSPPCGALCTAGPIRRSLKCSAPSRPTAATRSRPSKKPRTKTIPSG